MQQEKTIRFTFTAAFNWERPGTGETVAHKPGTRMVEPACAEAAQARGRGHVVKEATSKSHGPRRRAE